MIGETKADPAGSMTIDSMELAAALERRASRHETPCGAGSVVWRVWGDPAPEGGNELAPVVLLHGGSGSWTHWVRNIDALVDAGRRVIAPDLPGFGDSARPAQGGDADALAQPIEDGMYRLLGDTACDLVGFSFGGLVATFIGAQFPARVRRLVLVGAPALGLPREPMLLRAWTHLEPGPARQAVIRANLAALMLVRPESIDAFALALQERNVERDRMRKRRLARTDVLVRTLPRVPAPLYGIWGGLDAIHVGHTVHIEPALRSAPGFRWLERIPGAGHWVQFEAASLFDAALAKALSCAD